MRFLTRKRQQELFKRIHNVVVFLANTEGIEADYAIGDMWQIARMVGGREMLDAMVGDNYHQRPLMERVGDKISDSMDAADGWLDDLLEEI